MKAFCLFLASTSFVFAEPKIQEGEIEGAKFLVLSPEKPNGKVLLLAHGWRPEDAALSAKFSTDSALETALMAEGWVIASTSYRRNGWIIDDALTDLAALQAKVTELHGEATRTFILGTSMGGRIAVLAAEGKLAVDGAIAIGSSLQDFPKESDTAQLNYTPKVPLILLINQETNREWSKKYHEKAGEKFTAFWKIERPGHCNVSDLEKLTAIRALEGWLDGEKIPRQKDATEAIPQTGKLRGGLPDRAPLPDWFYRPSQ